jgi:AcrR family transcriptional regulator
MASSTTAMAVAPRRGRPPAASREDVLAAAMHRYLRGRRIDVQAIAAELGLGRTTIYQWFGSREGLIGEVLNQAADGLLGVARSQARGRGGALLLDVFDRFNRALADAPALRQFVEREREVALRIITSSGGIAQPHNVARIVGVIEDEVRAGNYDPPVDPGTLGYAIVRLAEAFLFNDAAAGMRGDVDRLKEVEAAILGVKLRMRANRATTAVKPSA